MQARPQEERLQQPLEMAGHRQGRMKGTMTREKGLPNTVARVTPVAAAAVTVNPATTCAKNSNSLTLQSLYMFV